MNDRHIIQTIKKTMPAVVSIVITKHYEDLRREMAHGIYPFLPGHGHENEKHKKFLLPKGLADKDGMVQVGGGSGFIADPFGLVLTNKHVIDDPTASYTVILDNGSKFEAKVLSRDPIDDVAILSIPSQDLPVIPLGDASKLELGQSVIAIGNALGLFKNTVSVGIVSGLSRSIQAKGDPNEPLHEMRGLIQTDAAINPGNSGGPLVDLDGRAIGINSALIYGAQSISFAIPINAAKRDLEDIKKYGRIKRPLLGVRYLMVNEAIRERMDLPVNYGAYVIKEGPHDPGVIPGSPAEKAGLREKDIIIECNRRRIDRNYMIQDFLEEMNVGDKVALTVMRGKKKMAFALVLAERI